jgi:hypothetical protein
MTDVSRRTFLAAAPAGVLIPALARDGAPSTAAASPSDSAPASFPHHDPAVVREIVSVSHGNVARVKELVSSRPALARAAWEWGYGDWETALGAASHVGNKEIAAVLLAAGAHPTIFSAAMLGQLDAVKAFIAASPGIQKTRGPHGISLMDHAKAGGSAEVVKLLESVGDAQPRYPSEPMADGDPDALLGTYAFGPGATDRLIVSRNDRGVLVIKREGEVERNLFHHGERVFNPSGAEAVRIRFEPTAGSAASLVVVDGSVTVRAARV